MEIKAGGGINQKPSLITGVQYYYCNVYKNLDDLDDETLLDWWL
jgi:hypothetical protein